MATDDQPDHDDSRVQTIQPRSLGASGNGVPFYRTTIEPILVLFVASLVLSQLTTQLYIHSSVSERYKNDSLVNATADSCKANATSPAFQTEQLIQEETSKWVMSFTFAFTLPGVASTLVIGSLTDIYGRKLGIMLALAGTLVRAVITLIVMVQKSPLYYLFFGYIFEGFTGSFGTMIMAGFSYVSDISDSRRKRSVRIAITEASMAMGSAVASLGGGFWIDAYGYTGPIVLVIVLQSLNILLVLLILHETVTVGPSNWKASLLSVRRCFKLFHHDTPEKRRWKLVTIMLAFFFTAPAALVESSLKTLFLLNFPLCWDSVRIGFYNFISTATSWIMIVVLVRCLQKFAVSDRYATFIGYAGAIVTFSLLTMADNNTWMYTLVLVGGLNFLPLPMLRSMISKLVQPDELGATFASVASIEMLCALVFNLVFNSLYQATLMISPGFVFGVIAIVQFLGMTIMIFYNIRMNRESRSIYDKI